MLQNAYTLYNASQGQTCRLCNIFGIFDVHGFRYYNLNFMCVYDFTIIESK